MSNADEIKKLKELLDSGVISEDEFNNEKNKLLIYHRAFLIQFPAQIKKVKKSGL